MKLVVVVIAAAVSLPFAVAATTDNFQYLDPSSVAVERANTIWIGDARDQAIQLVGFKAPETDFASCQRERIVGLRATARIIELIETEPATLQIVPCGCPAGYEHTQECSPSRKCGIVTVGGRDVGKTLIAEGLAVPHACTPSGCPDLPQPWCSK